MPLSSPHFHLPNLILTRLSSQIKVGKGRKREIASVPVRVLAIGGEQMKVIQKPVVATATLGEVLQLFGIDIGVERVVNGLFAVPDDAFIMELWRSCQSADHFLYVVVK